MLEIYTPYRYYDSNLYKMSPSVEEAKKYLFKQKDLPERFGKVFLSTLKRKIKVLNL